MGKIKTVGIQTKPEVDLDAIEAARLAEEADADRIVKQIEAQDDEDDEDKDPAANPPVVPPAEPKKPVIDWEQKAKDSQKEAMILHEQLKKIEEEKVKKVEINEDYLTKIYPDWQDLTLGEQRALKESEILKQEIQQIKNDTNKYNNDRDWNTKVEAYATEEVQDIYPDIVGREEEFKRFATRPTRKGLPLDDLAKIFLFENPKPVEPKKSLFHAPGSSGAPAPQNDGMSSEDVRILRTTRPTEYMRLVRAGKIKLKI